METKDLIIYNGIFAAAEHVFKNTKCPAGEYTAKDLAKNMLSKYYYNESFWNNEINHIFSVEFNGYKCNFSAGSAFNICAEIETAWGIPSARRRKFIKKADAAPVAVAFDVPAVSKSIINAVAPAKSAAADPVKYICVDAARRAIVATNGHVLTAAAVPEMFVNLNNEFTALLDPNKTRRFCLDATLFKTGKGNIKIRGNETAANGTNSKQLYNCFSFPSWEKVLPAVSEDAALILGKDFSALKKAILAAAKFSNTSNHVVILRAAKVAPEIEIISYKENAKDPKIADQEKVIKIKLSQPVPFSFLIAINGKNLDAVAAADKMYLISEKQPVIFTAANYFALIMPVILDNTPYHDNFFNSPAANVNILDICNFPALDAANSAAAVASVQDEETAAPAADSWENNLPRAVVCFNDINLFAEDQRARLDEIRNAAPAAEDAPAVQDEETAPAVQDAAPADSVPAEDETRPAFEDAAAAFADEMPEYFNNLNLDEEEKARAAFAAALLDEETAAPVAELETAPAVQDAQPAPAAEFVPADRLKIWGVSPAVQDLANYSPAVAAQMKIQNNVFIYNSILPGLIMQHKYNKDLFVIILDATNKGYKTKELFIYPNSRKRAKLITKYYFKLDIQPGGKSLFDVCPAAEIGKVLNILADLEKYIYNLAAPVADPENAPAVASVQDAPAVQDEETAPAVQDAAPAVSLPVPVSAVYPLHAVYIDNCLHGVYFSQLLADEVFFNNFFAGRAVDFLTFPSSETAPAVFRADPENAPAEDEETAAPVQDETPAPAADPVPAFASVFAIMPEIWETAAPAAEDAQPVPFLDEETPAPFAAEDAPAVAAFYLAADFSRRARRFFNVAAAVFCLLLITAAPRIFAPAVQDAQPAPAFILDEETAPAVAADSVPAAELRNSPETARAAAADSLPADRMKQSRNARKRARRADPDNLAPAVAVSLPVAADSVPFVAAADSVPFMETAAPVADPENAPAVASVQDAPETAPAVQDAAPAAEDEETAAPADPAPAEDAPAPANSPAPAVPVPAPGCPAVPAALLLILML